MKNVVRRMLTYKLRPVLAKIKREVVNNELLKAMKVPAKLGGEVEILLSIQYLKLCRNLITSFHAD